MITIEYSQIKRVISTDIEPIIATYHLPNQRQIHGSTRTDHVFWGVLPLMGGVEEEPFARKLKIYLMTRYSGATLESDWGAF